MPDFKNNLYFKTVSFLLLFLGGFGVAQAVPELLILNEEQEVYRLENYLEVLLDPTNSLSYEEVSLQKSNRFRPINEVNDLYDKVDTVVWLRFRVSNESTSERFLLSLGFLDEVELFGGLSVQRDGMLTPYRLRENHFGRYPYLEIDLFKGEEHTFYLRAKLQSPIIKSNSKDTQPLHQIKLYHYEEVEEIFNDSQYFLGLHTGIMLLMILYNLVVFVFIRDKSYIFYILFLALYTLSSATIDGSTYEFLWGNFPEWNLVATRHLLGFAWIFYLLFTRDFLNTKAQLPKWNLVLNICVVFQFGIILLNIFGIWLNWLAIIQVLTSMIVIFAVSGIIAKQGFRPAYFFLAANFCLLIVISLLALFGLGVIETNPFDYYALQIGMTFQVLLFATALADKINLMQHQIISQQKEKRQIIQEQNSELETRVKTRTEELEGKNYMLTNQKREIVIQNKELEQQNEEITAQKEMIEAQKQVVSKAYKDIKVLKEMGRKINSTLDIKEIIKIAYENISKLVTSTAFGIGTVDWDSEQIEMIGYYKHGKHFPDYYVPLSQDKRLIIWSVLNNKDVFVNDYHAEYEQYAQQKFESEMDIEIPNSLVYIPLSIKGKVIGILLVQSDDKNAFTEAQFDILKSFAEYVTVGVDHAEAYSQVKDMNKELGIKNTQIIDSLRYAKTIQDAILTDSEKFRQAFLEYFIFYHAKDVVSGDFYWLAEQKGKMLIACVDCTGHGVPGAFMSMVGHELLNEIVVQKGITDPSLVLMMLHRGVRKALQQEIGKNDDGMDMSLCVIDRKDDQEVELTFSCAKSSIFYTKDGILTESKGDRKSIGGIQKEASRKFTSQTVQLKRGDTLYLSTDGFFDQHNMDRKKFGKKQFIEMLDEIKSESFENQRAIIKDRFYDFKENQYQRDDVTVIGLKL